MYCITFDSLAFEFLKKSEKELAKRIWNKLISSKEAPHHFFERLKGRKDYRLRVGDCRVIADIDEEKMAIRVTHIGHRKNIYKNL